MTLLTTMTAAGMLVALPLCAEPFAKDPAGTPSLVVPVVTGLSHALQRTDLALARSGVAMRHIQGAAGETLADAYLNRGSEWTPLRQTVGRQGIDLLHVKVLPDGRIADTMISEVKTGGSQLNMTKSGQQMSASWKAERLLKIHDRYLKLGNSLRQGSILVEKMPKTVAAKQTLDIPLGNNEHAVAWRENSTAAWKIDAAGADMTKVKNQADRLGQHLNAVAHNTRSHRSRIIRLKFESKGIKGTVKDASGVALGAKESRLPVLHEFKLPTHTKNLLESAIQKAWEPELSRTQPLLTDVEVRQQAKSLALHGLRHGLADGPKNQWTIASKHAVRVGAWGAVTGGLLDATIQYWDTGSADWERSGAFAIAGGGSAAAGSFTGFWTMNALLNTQSGLALTRTVAASMGIQTTYAANLLGSASGAAMAAAGVPYLLYFMGQIDITTANRMAVAGGIGTLAGIGASWAATSLIATYGVAGTGTAIASLSGAAASSATLAWIGGGSVAVGSALSWTGVGLIAVGAGIAVNWGFEAWDQSVEAERLKHTARYLDEHYAPQQ